MKKIKNKYHLLVSSLLTILLGFLGASCVFSGPVMYGPAVPENTLEVDGEVTNEAGEPLESMQVVINTSRISIKDTVYTNASGEFERAYGFPQEGNDTLLIEVNDTSDVYASEKVQIPFTEMTKETDSEWSTEYSVDVKLQLKKK
jgi:putative lipoprotein (rSAM/lipoprotein system)